jgi:mono/diheme cytochrome c family protein
MPWTGSALLAVLLALPAQADNQVDPLIRTGFGDEAAIGPKVEAVGLVVLGIDPPRPIFGQAIRLGDGAYLRVPDLGPSDSWTIELWVRLREEPAQGIAALYAADSWEPGHVHFNLKPDGVLELAINGAGGFALSGPGAIERGRWAHVAATADGPTGELRLYVDGRLAAEAETPPTPSLRLATGSVGAWLTGSPTRPLAADIDEFALYPRALPHHEIRRLAKAGSGPEAPPVDFAEQVLPILEANCFDCHGPGMKKGELRLDIRSLAMLGGGSGEPAISPYDPEASEIVRRVAHPDPSMAMPPGGEPLEPEDIETLRNWVDQGAPWPDELAGTAPAEKVETDHWSFQPIARPEPPVGAGEGGTPVDAFIAARLKSAGLEPSPEADRRTLIRRLYLDVHGLPPTPEEIARFVADPAPDAWARLVDHVLASPRYGERWATHWLDVIRYGDTHGFEVNTPRPNAWPYRDYVIKSLNDDKPFDTFLHEQIAGDRLGVGEATGFLVAAPALLQGQVGQDLASKRQARADELHEVIVSVGSGVMGLTVGCARCHNHKFDPISQRDYYEMQAVFAGLRYGDRVVQSPAGAEVASRKVFAGMFTTAPATNRLYRGDPMQRRERVVPDVPASLGALGLESDAAEADRRLALAHWLTGPENPLTARVIANRVWQHHFGTGLVATPSDFGKMGFAPTHPELLDWLASSLIDGGWSLKALHRTILLSSTYRQSSRPRDEGLAADAGTTLLWRFPPRRLDMEPIRDSILAVSGSLDLKMGGPGFLVFKDNDNYVRIYEPREEWGPEQWRRMVYAQRVRMTPDGIFGAFDCPDAGQPAPKRGRSTTAIQALNLLNSTFVAQQAEILADRARRESAGDDAAALDRIFLLAFGRPPADDERADCLAIASEHGLDAVARAVLNSNEFLFLP